MINRLGAQRLNLIRGRPWSFRRSMHASCVKPLACQLLLVSNPFWELVTFPSLDRLFVPWHVASKTALNFNQSNYFYELHFLFEVGKSTLIPRTFQGSVFACFFNNAFPVLQPIQHLECSWHPIFNPHTLKSSCGWFNMRKCKSLMQ